MLRVQLKQIVCNPKFNMRPWDKRLVDGVVMRGIYDLDDTVAYELLECGAADPICDKSKKMLAEIKKTQARELEFATANASAIGESAMLQSAKGR